jgi:4-amino-4-deoxy-L-arabinose transferase-like glycosyltransferase
MDHQRTIAPGFVIAAITVLVAAAALLMPAAYFTIDEAHYHLMAEGLVEGFRFDIPNRLDAGAPPEMTPFLAVDVDGRITSQYPHLYAFLAAPFEWAFGLRGLYVLNAVAYVIVLVLTCRIAVRLTRDRTIAAWACAVFAFATYSLQYAAAIWPHILALAFIVAATLAVLRSNEHPDHPAGLLWAGIAGLCIGVGIGVRLDVAFGALAIAALIMLEGRWIVRGAVYAAGAIPGLAALAAINLVKFGNPLPFSYGADRGGYDGSVLHYLPIVAGLLAAFGVVAAAGFLWRVRSQKAGPGSYLPVAVGAIGLVVLAVLLVKIGPRLLAGLLQIVVDLRLRPLEIIEPAMLRTPDGGVFYHTSAKKALLQSCPFLLVVALDALRRLRDPVQRRAITVLFVPAAVYVPVFSYFAWHGGLAYNMRYLVPILPFLAILTAQTFTDMLRELAPRLRLGVACLWPVSALVISILGFEFVIAGPGKGVLGNPVWSEGHALWMLRLPLWIAVAATLCWTLRFAASPKMRVAATSLAAVTFAVALGSGSAAALSHDLVRTAIYRGMHHGDAVALGDHVPPDGLLVAPEYAHLYVLLADKGTHVAEIGPMPSRPLRVLAAPYVRAGRPAYLFAEKPLVDRLCQQGVLDQVELQPVDVHRGHTLYRIGIVATGAAGCGAQERVDDRQGGGLT